MTDSKPFNPIDPVTAANIEAMPLLSSLLPFKFGASSIDYVSAECACCGKEIEPDSIRGEFEIKDDGEATSLKAYAVCFGCHTLTPLEAKYNSDGTALYKGPNGWSENRWAEIKPEGVKALSAKFIRDYWQKLVPPALAMVVMMTWYLSR